MGANSPVSLFFTISGIPPAAVATTGILQAIASKIDVPKPSSLEVIKKTSSCGITSSILFRCPVKMIF